MVRMIAELRVPQHAVDDALVAAAGREGQAVAGDRVESVRQAEAAPFAGQARQPQLAEAIAIGQ